MKEELAAASLVAAEDTRSAARLLLHVGLQKPVVRIDEHASQPALARALDRIEEGRTLVMLTDAGTPGVSDPGAALADLAYERGFAVDSMPGPSAVSNALALSGFFAQRYVFLGFLPRKRGAMLSELAAFKESRMTLVLFESPRRTAKTLAAVLEALGDRRVAVCREMTKLHQEVLRGRVSGVLARGLQERGEYTVVIEGVRSRGPEAILG